MRDRDLPYNDLPLLPPAVELETKVVLKQTIAANRVLAKLRDTLRPRLISSQPRLPEAEMMLAEVQA